MSAVNKASRQCYRKLGGRTTAAGMARALGAVWDTYYKFCVVRNPYDRMVSGAHNLSGVVARDLSGLADALIGRVSHATDRATTGAPENAI